MGYDVSSSPFSAVQAILSSLGEDDNYIELKYERIDGEEISETDVTLERRATVFREFSFHFYPDDRAFVLRLSSFKNPDTYLQLIERFKELKELGYVNAILDLRDNSGGDVYVASNIISAFIEDEDVPLFTMGREGKLNYHSFKSNGDGVEFDTLHVLVNENTASSAEITALCLKQHAGATLGGKKTVGKAVAQSAATLIDDSTYGITTFVAYDYRGQTYNEKGLMPTVYLDNPSVKFEFPTDLEWFNYINYVEAVDGAENEVVTALERRLELMGFMRDEFVDGKWDEHTTNAVTFLQLSVGQEPTGALTLPLVNSITDIVNTYKDYYYTVDNQLNAVLARIY
jgi:carboxyl-terminal processing protease